MRMDCTSRNKRFVIILATTFMVVCAVAGAFNYVVDPYGLFGSARIAGFNEIKPTAATRVRIAKPYMASALKPHTIIGGNSRPELGLDPSSPCWQDNDQPVFNMGIPGAGVYTQTQYVRHAVDVVGARRVLMGVDFFDFLIQSANTQARIDWNHPTQDFVGRLDLRDAHTAFFQKAVEKSADRLGGLFSLAVTADAVATIASQQDPDASTRRADGFNPAHDYRSIIRHEGQHVLFDQKNRELADTLARPGLGIFARNERSAEAFDALSDFLDWSMRGDVDVILFINPYHAHYLSLIEISGKWPLFEQWKRELTRIASAHAVILWDFNTVDTYSNESPPTANEHGSQMKWYWEPAHYRKEIGEMMISKMLGRACTTAPTSNAPGVRLSDATIENHLEDLRSALRLYAIAKPDEYAALESLMPRDSRSAPK